MRYLLIPSTLPHTDLTAWLLPQMSPFRLEKPLTHVHCPVLLSLAPWQVAPATHTWSSRQKSPRAISVQRDERYLLIKKNRLLSHIAATNRVQALCRGPHCAHCINKNKKDDSNLKDKNLIFIAIYTTVKIKMFCHHAKIDTDHIHSVSKFKC